MNDFGIFQAIERIINEDSYLSETIQAVVTETREETQMPYLVMSFGGTRLHIPSYLQTALVDCQLTLYSNYPGVQEIQDLMTRFDAKLDGSSFSVNVRALGMPGQVILKHIDQRIVHNEDREIRMGTLKYQARVTINRGEENDL